MILIQTDNLRRARSGFGVEPRRIIYRLYTVVPGIEMIPPERKIRKKQYLILMKGPKKKRISECSTVGVQRRSR